MKNTLINYIFNRMSGYNAVILPIEHYEQCSSISESFVELVRLHNNAYAYRHVTQMWNSSAMYPSTYEDASEWTVGTVLQVGKEIKRLLTVAHGDYPPTCTIAEANRNLLRGVNDGRSDCSDVWHALLDGEAFDIRPNWYCRRSHYRRR